MLFHKKIKKPIILLKVEGHKNDIVWKVLEIIAVMSPCLSTFMSAQENWEEKVDL